MDKTWIDQPDEVYQGASVIRFSGMVVGHLVEVRQVTWQPTGSARLVITWYLTVGNLFGSETVRCTSAVHVIDVLNLISSKKDKSRMDLPVGCVLLKNAER